MGMEEQTGFTLIELILTVAVLAILVTMGIPSFVETIRDNRLSTQANALITALNLARSEAIKREKRVTICKSADQSNCAGEDEDINWEDGWIVFVDDNAEGENGAIDAGEMILQVGPALSGETTLRTGGNFSLYVQYAPIGVSRGSGPGGNDTFRICDPRGTTKAKSIVVSPTGRPRIEEEAASCP